MVAAVRRTSAATKPRELRRPSSADFASVTLSELAELGEHAGALLAAAVHEHQGDVLGRRVAVGHQPVDGLLGQVLEAAHHHAAHGGEQRRRRELAERGEGEVGGRGLETSASASWPRTAARTRADRALAEELLLAGHQRDPAEDVARCGSLMVGAACTGATPRVGAQVTVSRVAVGAVRPGRDHQVAVPVGAQHLGTGRRERRQAAGAGWP